MAPWITEIVRLLAVALLEICCAVVLARAERRETYARRPYWVRQLIAGLLFGGAAIAATEFGIEVGGASVNLRDAAPLIAGLLFGGPAGITAGIIGGVERYAAASWGVGTYTQIACSLAAICAGLLAAALRKWFFEDRRPATWLYGLLIGVATEAGHMLLIFLTHLDDVASALLGVQNCALPMMTGTGLCVAAAIAAVRRADPAGAPAHAPASLESHLQKSLAICLTVSLCATMTLTWGLESMLAEQDTEKLLRTQLLDVPEELDDTLESALAQYTVWIAASYGEGADPRPAGARQRDGVMDILIVDNSGRVTGGTDPQAEGLDLNSIQEARRYLTATDGGMAGPRIESFLTPGTLVHYGAVRLADGNILIAEYSDAFVAAELRRQISLGALHRHIGTSGYLALADAQGVIVSGPAAIGETLAAAGFDTDGPQGTMVRGTVQDERVQYMYGRMDTAAGTCTAICVIPTRETEVNALVDVYLIVFSVILIFFALYLALTVLVRRRIVQEIHSVNDELGKITDGDLTRVVDVRSSDEFGVLSDGINGTVAALRDLIAKEAARVDADLELARLIQQSALPAVFPGGKEAAAFAVMNPAREVGGDFYDFFYLLSGEDRLAFLVADVSGKGIPAAMYMMRAKAELKSLAESGLPLTEVFCRANTALCDNNEASMFVTVWMGILNVASGELEYASAGHNPAILLREGEKPAFLKGRTGFVLGGIEGMPYESDTVRLHPGDTIVLYTDGVTEAENTERAQYTGARLLDCVRQHGSGTPRDICGAVQQDVAAFAGGAEQFDDLTILALRYFGEAGGGT